MVSRTLGLAAVTLLAGGFAVGGFAAPAEAQNLEAGKTPSQLFAATCSLCHKSSRGLLKTVPAGSLPGFLRQHYTTSSDMAAAMSAYVLSNGAADNRIGGDNLTREGKESRSLPKPNEPEAEGKPGQKQKPEPRSVQRAHEAKPEAEGPEPLRSVQRPPAAVPATEPQERQKEAEKLTAEQKLKEKKLRQDKKKQKPAAKDESKPPQSAPEAKVETKPETKPETTKPGAQQQGPDDKAETAKTDVSKPEGVTRPDPVPAVTPAPKPDNQPEATAPKTAEDKSATPSSGMPVFNVEPSPPAAPAPVAPPQPPAGPPIVPISK